MARRPIAAVLAACALSGCTALTLKRQVVDLKRANEDLQSRSYLLERDLEIARRAAERARDEAARARLERAGGPGEAAEEAGPAPATAKVAEVPSELAAIPEVDVAPEAGGVRIVLEDRILFDMGSAKLSSQGRAVLGRVAGVIRRTYADRLIRVDGHTDASPVVKHKATWPTNWELGAARACAVVRALVDRGLDPHRVFAASFGPYAPAASNRTADGRRRNRRVEIVVTGARP